MPAEDRLSAALGEIRDREQARDIPVLAAAVEALAKAHEPVQLYGSADNCGHDEPADDETDEWQDWDAEHPAGRPVDPDSPDGWGRICLDFPVPRGLVCPACSRLVQREAGTDEVTVPADECIVRPVIEAHLTGEKGTPDGA